jgi:hypothetical protein
VIYDHHQRTLRHIRSFNGIITCSVARMASAAEVLRSVESLFKALEPFGVTSLEQQLIAARLMTNTKSAQARAAIDNTRAQVDEASGLLQRIRNRERLRRNLLDDLLAAASEYADGIVDSSEGGQRIERLCAAFIGSGATVALLVHKARTACTSPLPLTAEPTSQLWHTIWEHNPSWRQNTSAAIRSRVDQHCGHMVPILVSIHFDAIDLAQWMGALGVQCGITRDTPAGVSTDADDALANRIIIDEYPTQCLHAQQRRQQLQRGVWELALPRAVTALTGPLVVSAAQQKPLELWATEGVRRARHTLDRMAAEHLGVKRTGQAHRTNLKTSVDWLTLPTHVRKSSNKLDSEVDALLLLTTVRFISRFFRRLVHVGREVIRKRRLVESLANLCGHRHRRERFFTWLRYLHEKRERREMQLRNKVRTIPPHSRCDALLSTSITTQTPTTRRPIRLD